MRTPDTPAMPGRALEALPLRPNAVSRALPASGEEAGRGGAARWEVRGPAGGVDFRIRVAADRATRERAYRLAYRVYRQSGYASGDPQWIVAPYDGVPETLTLLAEDACGREAATISLAFDSIAGLPSDELYGEELAPLRAQGRRLAEVTRLAIDARHTRSKALLVSLFNFVSVYARHLSSGTDFVIEVSPRHVAFYLRLLLFEPLGPPKNCPRVNGAEATLLRLDLNAQVEELGSVGGSRGLARGPHGRTLYAHFHSLAEEAALAAFLARSRRPISPAERDYFGLKQGDRP